jgi:hypothetical protein
MAYKSNYHAEKIKKQHKFFKPPLIPLPFEGGGSGRGSVSFVPLPLIPWGEEKYGHFGKVSPEDITIL